MKKGIVQLSGKITAISKKNLEGFLGLLLLAFGGGAAIAAGILTLN